MSSATIKKGIDITNLVFTVIVTLMVSGICFFGSKGYTTLSETHDYVIQSKEQIKGLKENQEAQKHLIEKQDEKINHLITQNKLQP